VEKKQKEQREREFQAETARRREERKVQQSKLFQEVNFAALIAA
jgi:hypothetical protein